MTVVHARFTCAEDYLTRREPVRKAHIERLLGLRAAGLLVAGGPAPDGRSAELFYRVPHKDALRLLVTEDPYHQVGAWTAHLARDFETFVDPWDSGPPVVLDGSRRATVVEGPAADRDMAQLALVELRGAGRVVFGGFFPDGDTLAVALTPDADAATGWLAETGSWKPGDLSARPWLYAI
jgi:uncharacterized protein YciI